MAGEVARRGWAYEGFWRTTRPSGHFQNKFIHDHVMIQAGAEGALEVMMGVLHVRLTGLAQLLENQMFISLASNPPNEIVFCILNVTPRLRAEVLDGLTLTRIADSSGSPVAGAILFERIGDLKGDRTANLREFEALCARNAVVEPESIPQAVRDHLCRGMGPTTHAQGGNMLLTMHAAVSMARGPAFKLPDADVVKPAD